MIKLTLTAAVGSIFGALMVIYAFNLKRPKRKKKKQDQVKIEFKKKMVFLVLMTYFIGVAIGAYIVILVDPSQLSYLLTYIGGPTTGAILSYCWVVRTENAIKLKKAYPEETEGVPIDLNNTNM